MTITSTVAFGQNQIRVRAGFLSTNTSVSEYSRGIGYFYYDSVTIDSRATAATLNMDIDLDMGKKFYFSTGLSYSKKGLPVIFYPQGQYGYTANQEYMGMNFQVKYHYKFSNDTFGLFAATGFRSDFAVGGPPSAEIANDSKSAYFQSFGTFKSVEFSFNTILGISYRLGPGDITLDGTMLYGLSDTLTDRFSVGRTFSIGANLGYSWYL
jgi:hypothetical protein